MCCRPASPSGRDPSRSSGWSGCATRAACEPLEPRSAVGRRARSGVRRPGDAWTGRPIVCYAQDSSIAAGSVGVAEAEVIVRALRHSRAERGAAGRLPGVVGRAPAGRRRGAGRLRADLLRERGAVRALAADLGDHRRLCRRRLLLAGADRFRRDDRERVDVPDRAADRQAGARRGGERPSLLGGARVHARNGVCDFVAADDRGRVGLLRELLVLPAPERRRARRRWRPPSPPRGDPAAVLPPSSRGYYDVRELIAPARRRRALPGGHRALGAQHGGRLRAAGGTRDRDRSPTRPATAAGSSTSRRRRRAGSSSAPATPSASRCSCWSDTPGFMPGKPRRGRRRDRPRRRAAAGVRRRPLAAGDGDRAQGIRRGVHHDELQGSRRGRRVLLAGRGDRDHERRGRGRDHARAPARTRRAPQLRELLARRYAERQPVGPGGRSAAARSTP